MEVTNAPKLPKLPFIVADVILIIAAIIIANSGEGPLKSFNFFWIIVAVALGGVLACLPFYIEFHNHMRLALFDKNQGSHENTQRLETALGAIMEISETVTQQNTQCERAATIIGNLDQRLEAKLDRNPTDNGELFQKRIETTLTETHTLLTQIATLLEKETEETIEPSESSQTWDDFNEDLITEEETPQEEASGMNSEAPISPEPTSDLLPLANALSEASPQEEQPPYDESTLVAQVLIGIGNKPYIRGTGPGLSEDTGVPMDFLEIGKWQWVAPESDQTIVCRILKNDEIEADGEPILIEPGQTRRVSPRFP